MITLLQPVSQTRRLPPRRRANQGIDSSALISASSSNPQTSHSHFSQLDKYKALFDASDPDREPLSGEIEPGTGASTQGVRTGTLNTVPEEEEQVGEVQSGGLRGAKRTREVEIGDDGDVEMVNSTADVAGSGADTMEEARRAKRRALDANAVPPPTAGVPAAVPASQSRTTQTQGQGKGQTTAGAKPTSKAAAAAKPLSSSNKLDTDENFLKAVNSMKRGKKHEDDFDREFNQLRITKPKNVNVDTIDSGTTVKKSIPEPVDAPWDAIDDFGDAGIRGNFMVVVEMDIQRGASVRPALTARNNDAAHPEWTGRPNFKKFKTVRISFTLLLPHHLGYADI